jgi:hypothetical protein
MISLIKVAPARKSLIEKPNDMVRLIDSGGPGGP